MRSNDCSGTFWPHNLSVGSPGNLHKPSLITISDSIFGQVLHFSSATKGAVIWKTRSKFHKPGCSFIIPRVQARASAQKGNRILPFCSNLFLACMPSHLLLKCLRVEHCKKLGRAGLSHALENPFTYVYVSAEPSQKSDISGVT